MKFEEYISEVRISGPDKKNLVRQILNSKQGTVKINSLNRTINIGKKGNILNVDFIDDTKIGEMTATLVDIADTLGMNFEVLKDDDFGGPDETKTRFVLHL